MFKIGKPLILILLLFTFISCEDLLTGLTEERHVKEPISNAYKVVEGTIEVDIELVSFTVNTMYDSSGIWSRKNRFKINAPDLEGFDSYLFVNNPNGEVMLMGKTNAHDSPIVNVESTSEVILEQFLALVVPDQESFDAAIQTIKSKPLYSDLKKAVKQSIDSEISIYSIDNTAILGVMEEVAFELIAFFELSEQIKSAGSKKAGKKRKAVTVTGEGNSLYFTNLDNHLHIGVDIKPKGFESNAPLYRILEPGQKSERSPTLADGCYDIYLTNGFRSITNDADKGAFFGTTKDVFYDLLLIMIGKIQTGNTGSARKFFEDANTKPCITDFITNVIQAKHNTLFELTKSHLNGGKSNVDLYNAYKDALVSTAIESSCITNQMIKQLAQFINVFNRIENWADLISRTTKWGLFYNIYEDDAGDYSILHEKFYVGQIQMQGTIEDASIAAGAAKQVELVVKAKNELGEALSGMEVSWKAEWEDHFGNSSQSYRREWKSSSMQNGVAKWTFDVPEGMKERQILITASSMYTNMRDDEAHVEGSPVHYVIETNPCLESSAPRITNFSQECGGPGGSYILYVDYEADGYGFNPAGNYYGSYNQSSYPVIIEFRSGGEWQHSSNGYKVSLMDDSDYNKGKLQISLVSPTGRTSCEKTDYYTEPLTFHDAWRVRLANECLQESNNIEFSYVYYAH